MSNERNEATAKELIKKDRAYGKEMASLYVPNIMRLNNEVSKRYGELSELSVANRKEMIRIFGSHNLTCYNISGKKNQLNALLTGQNANRNAGFKLLNSKGNGYGNL